MPEKCCKQNESFAPICPFRCSSYNSCNISMKFVLLTQNKPQRLLIRIVPELCLNNLCRFCIRLFCSFTPVFRLFGLQWQLCLVVLSILFDMQISAGRKVAELSNVSVGSGVAQLDSRVCNALLQVCARSLWVNKIDAKAFTAVSVAHLLHISGEYLQRNLSTFLVSPWQPSYAPSLPFRSVLLLVKL